MAVNITRTVQLEECACRKAVDWESAWLCQAGEQLTACVVVCCLFLLANSLASLGNCPLSK